MRQDAMKSFSADFAFANVFVAIDAAAKREFRIVGVKDGNATEPNRGVDYVDRRGQPGFAPDVVARGKEMRGIEAGCGGDIFKTGEDFRNFFETRANGHSHPCCVFDEDAEVAEREALRALFHGLDDRGDGLLWRRFPARAGMNDQEIRAESYATHELVVEGLDGASPQHRLRGREIDQIVCMNDERAEAEFGAAGAKRGGVHFGDTRGATLPHTRARRKNLERVAA